MGKRALAVLGAGIVTDGYADVRAFVERREVRAEMREAIERTTMPGEETVGGHDAIVQFALKALSQAWSQCGPMDGRRVGLIVVTGWGMMEATEKYLESMLEAEGRYASPRHFTRSVYSHAASVLAIQFGIRGPCMTLAFDPGEDVVLGAMSQAWRMLAMRRAERVAVVWAEQTAEIAEDLARRAVERLARREFARYAGGIGEGAVAVIVGMGEGIAKANLDEPLVDEGFVIEKGKPFTMDRAVGFLRAVLNDVS
jgi:3-oxoacyl-(acyl-carrier-protein) synthase